MTRLLLGVQGSGQLVGGLPDPSTFAAAARLAEGVGFDSIWAGDHVSFEHPILDITVALSTFAAVTSRITIGAGIVLLPLRPPALVAKAFSSLDCAARVHAYAEAGVRHLVFNPVVPPDRLTEQIERLGDAVVAVVA